jgi:hypothetical protein
MHIVGKTTKNPTWRMATSLRRILKDAYDSSLIPIQGTNIYEILSFFVVDM